MENKRIEFDIEELLYQKEAVNSIVDLFINIPKVVTNPIYGDRLNVIRKQTQGSGKYVRNRDISLGNKFLENLRYVQFGNNIFLNDSVDLDKGILNLTVEMETGTGKTYVYLKTIMELYKQYKGSFNKFIIVVPSVAIRLGVQKSIEIFKDKLAKDYDGIDISSHVLTFDANMKDPVVSVRDNFLDKNKLSILIINTQAFNSVNNRLRDRDAEGNVNGISVWDEMKEIHPIIILDEPQKFDGGTSKKDLTKTMKAIYETEPRFIIRYSATHRSKMNLVYELDSYDAYINKLVKRIRVRSITRQVPQDFPYIKYRGMTKNNDARVEIFVKDIGKEVKVKTFDINKDKDNIYELSGDLKQYKDFRLVENPFKGKSLKINANGIELELKEGEDYTPFDEKDIIRLQIRIAIESHLEQQFKLLDAGKEIKALSLFFIDEVAKVRGEDGEDGEYFKIFDEEYSRIIEKEKWNSKFEEYGDYFKNYNDVKSVRQGYFAIDKLKTRTDIIEIDENKKSYNQKERRSIENGIELILNKKEELISFDTSLAFIFSHSALREGWDNPNIFTLCTLKKSDNEIAKKQEIGRGLRLPVDIYGKRHKNEEYNVLTVVANSSYDEFSKSLQNSYNEEAGFNKEEVSADIILKVFKDAGLKPSEIDAELSSTFLKELKDNGIVNAKGELKKDIEDKLEKLEFENEVLNIYSIKLKEEIVKAMEEKGSKRIIIEDGDKKKVVNRESSFVNEDNFKNIVFNLGDRLSYRTAYRININEDKFLKEAVKNLNEYFKYKDLQEQYYSVEEGMHYIDKLKGAAYEGAVELKEKIEDKYIRNKRSKLEVVDYIMEGTDLPRKSIGEIYDTVEKKHLFNSQEYLDGALNVIKCTLLNNISESPIEYDLLEGYSLNRTDIFKMDTIINTEIGKENVYLYPEDPSKENIGTKRGINRYYKFDSKGEQEFAIQLDRDPKVKLFTKLSKGGFIIDTPYGSYTPDWAIVYENNNKDSLYFISETKIDKEFEDLSDVEQLKIKCGEAHFKTISEETGKDVSFSWAKSYIDFKEKNNL
ncbi:type III restriction enzyme, res subunit [Clostridium acetireducens DSM 10703]|uniref:Type III restriction enzyme, res subunit n=1 Tax=Clostridium acetireducens DSM 10703 TaxID=1121290 RepID=A0A1E8F0W0_9CLOT|nr:DEAD/DEAH box helicase family protein [Clostridium acetireducens]OFI07089.1 type III restriction enzyme, res subunit [Clostridium acetireducens DSM 10703]